MGTGGMRGIAPTTGVCAAPVPVLAGPLPGGRIGGAAAIGVVVPLAAGLLIAAEGGLGSRRAVRAATLVPALVAGLLFGLFFVFLHRTNPDAELAPLIAARVASVLLVGLAALVGRSSVRISRRVLPLVVLAGLGDGTANAPYLLATQHGQLAITGVLASLYPASTVLLAQLVLRERLVRTQAVGLVAAGAAVVLIALPA